MTRGCHVDIRACLIGQRTRVTRYGMERTFEKDGIESPLSGRESGDVSVRAEKAKG